MTTKAIKSLTHANSRIDFYCCDCQRITSLYLRRGDAAPLVATCGFCGESFGMEKYSPIKHGSISGFHRTWRVSEKRRLVEMLKNGLGWQEIGKELKRNPHAIAQRARVWGYLKYRPEKKPKEVSK